ncbi:hypothetical protein RHSP_03298 [Rhizobium freirei PRF 81]|uniref:Uncharacterized protein n=1 Tax=Rhizobium freirei PRF 81 TaxID=363754 RepID=N6VD23_9HYPH|nr:hypothetical protein RHSP_03298 [Rhizobium freirei PRF 81]
MSTIAPPKNRRGTMALVGREFNSLSAVSMHTRNRRASLETARCRIRTASTLEISVERDDPIEVAERAGAGQQGARLFLILADLRDQRIQAVELQFGTKIAEEGNRTVLAIEIAAEIEDEGLEQRRTVVGHRRTAAVARNGVADDAIGCAELDGIDAGLQRCFRRKLHVGGREAQRAAKLLATDDGRFNGIAIAQQTGDLGHLPFGQKRANTTRGDDLGIFVAERVDQGHAKTVVAAGIHQEGGAALTVVAEMEIETGDDFGGVQPIDEDRVNELIRGALGKGAIERIFDDGVEAESFQQAGLQRRRRQAEDRMIRLEHGARMRLEGQHEGRNTAFPRNLQRATEHRLMTAMYAVKIADGDDPALESVWKRFARLIAMENGHRLPNPLRQGAASTTSAKPVRAPGRRQVQLRPYALRRHIRGHGCHG